jgi:hypothetical protein
VLWVIGYLKSFCYLLFVSIYGSSGKSDFAFWVVQGLYFELGKVFGKSSYVGEF